MTTLTTGPNAEGVSPRGGFTLLELVLVMVVICTVLAMAAPSLRGFFASRQTADTASGLVALTQFARTQAVAQGRVYRLNFDTRAGAYWLTAQEQGAFQTVRSEFGRVFHLPEGVRSELQVEGADQDRSYVDFFPDGRTEPARIVLAGRQGDVVEVSCLSPAERFRVGPADEEDYR